LQDAQARLLNWRNIKDLSWNNQPVVLRINRRQFRCKNCQKPFSEDLDFVDKQRGYTKRFAIEIVQQVLDSNIHSVAERNDLSESEVQSMLDYLESEIRADYPREIASDRPRSSSNIG
jgi:transposase